MKPEDIEKAKQAIETFNDYLRIYRRDLRYRIDNVEVKLDVEWLQDYLLQSREGLKSLGVDVSSLEIPEN